MRALIIATAALLTACSQQPQPLEQLVWPPDDQLPTGGTIPIKRLVDSCKAGTTSPDLCRQLHRDLTKGANE